MSKLLIDEPPLQVLPSLAIAIGLNEAIFLQQLHYWLKPDGKYEPHYRKYEGITRPWIYNTYHTKDTKNNNVTGWQANFPFWSIRTIKRIVTSLKRKGLIIVTDEFNDSSTNRTSWYTIDYKTLDALSTSGTLDSDKVALSEGDNLALSGGGQLGTVMTETTPETTNRDIPLEKKSSGLSLKTQTDEPDIFLVDTPLGPHPQSLENHVADLARSTAETLDTEIIGDELTNVFGPNGRQSEIDAWQEEERPSLDPDALLLGAMVGPVSAAIRSKLVEMRGQGWKVKDSEIELALAQFFEITQFVIPTSKSRRKFFEASVREHIQEELFSGRVGELYETVWGNIAADVAAGDLEIGSPKSLTTFMYGVLNREAGPVSELTRAQLIDRLTDDKLVEVKEIDGAIGFVWIETGKLVGEIPTEIVARYSRASSSN